MCVSSSSRNTQPRPPPALGLCRTIQIHTIGAVSNKNTSTTMNASNNYITSLLSPRCACLRPLETSSHAHRQRLAYGRRTKQGEPDSIDSGLNNNTVTTLTASNNHIISLLLLQCACFRPLKTSSHAPPPAVGLRRTKHIQKYACH